jgi:hypothetical protein
MKLMQSNPENYANFTVRFNSVSEEHQKILMHCTVHYVILLGPMGQEKAPKFCLQKFRREHWLQQKAAASQRYLTNPRLKPNFPAEGNKSSWISTKTPVGCHR